jgi:hypothetical protein
MSIAERAPAESLAPTSTHKRWLAKDWGLLASIAGLILILLLPTPAGLPIAGHHMLAVLVFAVIVWMTKPSTTQCPRGSSRRAGAIAAGLSDDGLSLGIAFKGERIASPGAAEPSTTITEVERQFTIVA